MKYAFLLFLYATLFYGCQKEYSFEAKPAKDATYQSRSGVFPTVIVLGPDLTVQRTDTLTINGVYAYLSVCGFAPELEAPVMGSEVYQTAGPNTSNVNWTGSSLRLGNLIPGTYTYVGRAYIEGYRVCDSSFINDQAYDTLNVTVLKSRRKIK